MENIPVKHTPQNKKEHELLFDNPWFKVYKNKNFIYGERKGIDSIAFILLAKNLSDERRVGVVNEYKDPIEKFLSTAFGGSIDNEKYYEDLRTLVQDEVIEEAGFNVELSDITYQGKVMCSTQMNQFVHLFTVEVDKTKQGEKTTTNPTELLGSVQWLPVSEVFELEDWKAPTILAKSLNKKSAQIIQNN